MNRSVTSTQNRLSTPYFGAKQETTSRGRVGVGDRGVWSQQESEHEHHGLMYGLGVLYKSFTDYVEKESSKATIEVSGISKEDEDVVTESKKIATALMQAADYETSLEVAFGSRILTYEARIKLDVDDDPATDALSSEYLRTCQYILIGMDDPEGVEKMRTGAAAVVQFPHNNKFNEFYSRLIEEVGEESTTDEEAGPSRDEVVKTALFKVSFPDALFRKNQRRSSARFEVPASSRIKLIVERPALVTFPVHIRDISLGGLDYVHPDDVAPLTEKCHLNLQFTYDEDKELIIPGTLVKNMRTLSEVHTHVHFSIESYEMSRAVGELVTYVERSSLKERSDRHADPKVKPLYFSLSQNRSA